MFSTYLLFVSLVVVALSTLVIGFGRKGSESPRETGLVTIPQKAQVDIAAAVTEPPKVQPWKDWLQAEMEASSDPSRPWLDWKPNMDDPSDKPWLYWNKRKMEQGRSGAYEPEPDPDPETQPRPEPRPWPRGPTTEMMGTYPVINHARI
ncbi:uncharacterized protein NECHADRAFT_87271 [Fusarium vanettenii 77-13-4]|uniref:Secreted protein n=1 Tax=Fusarium vanettenii (strain ATCC MYA-4622 / CBS 123669 / FGSC 9596 / NRRL 45880 / 77-13-4) TaxID=660122 RepID=C7ZIU9_FUSV7|nr:uncharacterized protein NECHADRAFT_87271 [Fusarium vanettenii 77-13-4]EEU36148.1 predicted protein [Fusarium vanettenii 77-13-4]